MDPETLSALRLSLLCQDSYWGQKYLKKPVGSKLPSLVGRPQNSETIFFAKAYTQEILGHLGLDLPVHAAFTDGRLCITIGEATWKL